jgi:hypothetical protein
MEYVFIVSSEGIKFMKENEDFLYPNIEYDENESTVTLEFFEPEKSTIGQFMTEIKEQGLFLGRMYGHPIALDSECILKYPYELEAF